MREVKSPERVGVVDRPNTTTAGNIDLEGVGDGAWRHGAIGSPVPVGSSQTGRRCLILGAILSRVSIGNLLGHGDQRLLIKRLAIAFLKNGCKMVRNTPKQHTSKSRT